MKLFKLNSTEDLICRGYKQNEILKLTGIDTGYHNNKYKTLLKGIDRTLYKYEHIKQRFTNEEIQLTLDYYHHGATKQDSLNKLLIHDYEKLKLENQALTQELNRVKNDNDELIRNNQDMFLRIDSTLTLIKAQKGE